MKIGTSFISFYPDIRVRIIAQSTKGKEYFHINYFFECLPDEFWQYNVKDWNYELLPEPMEDVEEYEDAIEMLVHIIVDKRTAERMYKQLW